MNKKALFSLAANGCSQADNRAFCLSLVCNKKINITDDYLDYAIK